MLTGTGAWLRKQREARGWARREMARRLIQAAQAVDDTTVPGIENLCTYIRRWESSRHGPTERYRLYYCTALGISAEDFGTAPIPSKPKTPIRTNEPALPRPHAQAVPSQADPRLAASIALAYREMYGSFTVEREVLMAAHEGSDRAERAEEHGISEATTEQLHADVMRLSHLTDTGEPFPTFLEMRRVRDRMHRLLDRRLSQNQRTDLYFLLGCVNGLMGVTANRLGYPDAGAELIRTGLVYATTVDHHPLVAQLRCELSYVAYWRGWFADCRDQAVGGLEYLSAGPTGAELHLMVARSAARLGDLETARQSVGLAHDAHERTYNDDLLDIGGEFACSHASHYLFAGHALAESRGAEREASQELERAISLYEAGPGEREEHWFGGRPLAGINLALVRLRSGALDAAATAVEPALSLPAAQRVTALTTRLAAVRDELAAPIFSGSAQARELGERIEEFGREAVVAGLHSLRD